MNVGEEHFVRPGRSVVPPFSTRTLHHPSLMPLCVASGFARQQRGCDVPTLLPITPEEVFYTDPTMSRGRRIPNIASDFEVFEFFRLNTPPPVMSACLAPPSRPDPFRSGSHPTRDLGSPNWRVDHIPSSGQVSRGILRLTWDEEQAITNLLKLHLAGQSDETLAAAPGNMNGCHPHPTDSTSAEELNKPFFGGGQQRRTAVSENQSQQDKRWSAEELEAAVTLLSCYTFRGEDRIRAVTLPYPRPHRDNEELAMSTGTQRGSVASPALRSTGSNQSDTGAAGRRGVGSVSEAGGQELSVLEGDAVRVLLGFGDGGTLNILQ